MNGHIGHNLREINSSEGGSCKRLYTEQDWIDWLLGSIPEAKHNEMAVHLASCPVCLAHKERWEPIFKENSYTGAYAAESETYPKFSNAPDFQMPSDWIRRKLRFRVRLIAWRRAVGNLMSVRWRWSVALAASFLLLIGAGYAMIHLNQPTSQWNQYVETYEPKALSVMSNPETVSYPIDWGRMESENGRVWYNPDSEEMLMLVGGLVPDKGQTVRVWAVKEGTRNSLGLLQYHANRAHLYVKDNMLSNADNLILTVERQNESMEADALNAINTISIDLNGR